MYCPKPVGLLKNVYSWSKLMMKTPANCKTLSGGGPFSRATSSHMTARQ